MSSKRWSVHDSRAGAAAKRFPCACPKSHPLLAPRDSQARAQPTSSATPSQPRCSQRGHYSAGDRSGKVRLSLAHSQRTTKIANADTTTTTTTGPNIVPYVHHETHPAGPLPNHSRAATNAQALGADPDSPSSAPGRASPTPPSGPRPAAPPSCPASSGSTLRCTTARCTTS